MSTPFRLCVSEKIVQQMLEQALSEQPLECCGLLAGLRNEEGNPNEESVPIRRVVRCYPLVNAKASPKEFESDARGMFDAMRDMTENEYDMLAIYHSHPTSEAIPSKTDLARNYFPEVVNLIVSLTTSPPTLRAWWLHQDSFTEAELLIQD